MNTKQETGADKDLSSDAEWMPKLGDILAPKIARDVHWKVVGFRTIIPGVVDCFMEWPGREYGIRKRADLVHKDFVRVSSSTPNQ